MNFPVIKTQLQRKNQILTDVISYTGTDLESKGSVSQLMDDLDLINSVEKVEAMINSIQKGVENVLRK